MRARRRCGGGCRIRGRRAAPLTFRADPRILSRVRPIARARQLRRLQAERNADVCAFSDGMIDWIGKRFAEAARKRRGEAVRGELDARISRRDAAVGKRVIS